MARSRYGVRWSAAGLVEERLQTTEGLQEFRSRRAHLLAQHAARFAVEEKRQAA